MNSNLVLFRLATLCLLIMTASAGSAQQLPLDPEVKTGRLDNGLTYYIRKNPVQRKRVTLYLVVKAGSVLETDRQRGLAHFMEHMSFKGSKHFPGNTLVDFLQKSGVRFGADLNAYTSFDETVYQLPIPVDKAGMLTTGLQVIRDWAGDATLDEQEMNSERGVVLEEKRLKSGAQQRINDQTFPFMVNYSKYAERSPIGTENVLKTFSRNELQSFYKDWYRPDLEAVIVVGDVNVEQVTNQIRSLFSDLENPAAAPKRVEYQIELKETNHFLTVTDPEAGGTAMQVMIKHPHRPVRTNSDYLQYIKNNLFNQLIASRLQQVSQKNAENYLSASAGDGPVLANIDAFNAVLVARPGKLEKGFQAFWSEINSIKINGFSAEEVDEAKTRYLNNLQAASHEADKRPSAQLANEYVRNFLVGEGSPGITREAELTEAYLPAISTGLMNRYAQSLITDVNRDIIITAPDVEKNNLPKEEDVMRWIKNAENSGQYSENRASGDQKKNILPLLAQLPKKGKIISIEEIKELGVTRFKLDNGITVLLKPTTFRNDEILFTGFAPGGTSLYADKDYWNAANAAQFINQSGIDDYNAEQLQRRTSGMQLAVSPYINERTTGISGSCVNKDFEHALQMTYLYFTKPRKDTITFNAWMSRWKASLMIPDQSPERIFADSVRATLGNHSIRRKSPGIDDIDQITADRAFEIYRERFKNAGNFTFVFVGNLTAVQAKPLLETYLGALPFATENEKKGDLTIDMPKGVIKKELDLNTIDKATVNLVIHGDFVNTSDNLLRLDGLKQILQFHLISRLRGKESGVYSPGVSLEVNKYPKSTYAFSISFGCDPANAERLIAAVWDEIGQLKLNGPTLDDIKKFKTEQAVVFKNGTETNNFWMVYLASQLRDQANPMDVLGYNKRLDAYSASNLKDDANLYLTEGNYLRFLLMPKKSGSVSN